MLKNYIILAISYICSLIALNLKNLKVMNEISPGSARLNVKLFLCQILIGFIPVINIILTFTNIVTILRTTKKNVTNEILGEKARREKEDK